MKFDLEKINEIPILDVAHRLGIDIVKRNKAICFLHEEREPSLSFNVRDNYWFCFGCNSGGGVIQLVMEYLKVDFKEACKWLIKNYIYQHKRPISRSLYGQPKREVIVKHKINLEDKDLFAPNFEIYEWIMREIVLSSHGWDYLLNKRKYKKETIKKFNIKDLQDPYKLFQNATKHWGLEKLIKCGIATSSVKRGPKLLWSKNCLLFPFYNMENRISYIQARNVGESSHYRKYVNLANIPTTLFNLSSLNNIQSGEKITLCEGVTDAIMANQNGINALGVIGASGFKKEYVKILEPYEIFVIPDNDKAGKIFSLKVIQAFGNVGKHVNVINIENYKDLSDFFKNSK